jgi:hypothetical protein
MQVQMLAFMVAALSVVTNDVAAEVVVCDVHGEGSYYFDPLTLIDYYALNGELGACTGGPQAADLEGSRFDISGEVATVGLSGPGEIVLSSEPGESQGQMTMTGIPESLTMIGEFTSGSYVGALFEMTTLCTSASTLFCVQLGSSSFSYIGALTLLLE